MRTKFICGNWKMNKTVEEAVLFANEFRQIYMPVSGRKVAVAAPFTALFSLKLCFEGTGIGVGAQNMHFEDSGAFTGEVSAPMLGEIGVSYVIIGHSERRQYFGETDETVNRKLKKALAAGLGPIVCVGETLDQREQKIQFDVVEAQVKAAFEGIDAESVEKITVAYEPIWAIGTGKTASAEQAQEMCGFIRRTVRGLYGLETAEKLTIQYGGSVKASNAKELLTQPDIDGALVGGASLKPNDFWGIINY